jgi:hypothetical protein
MKHAILSGQAFGLMSGDRPLFRATANGGHEGLHRELTRRQIPFQVVNGKYGEPERSFFLPGISEENLRDLGERYGQESVIHSIGHQNKLLFTNGPKRGQHQTGHGHEVFSEAPEDFYTEIPGQGFFRLNLEGGTPHPNAYSWHDGNTEHHKRVETEEPVKKATQMEKLPPDAAGFPTPRGPANQGSTVVEQGPQNMPVGEGMKLDRSLNKANEQFAPAGVSTYGEFAQHYGGIGKPGSQNLKFYNYGGHGQAINDLLQQHGYSHYYAGGKYGKPDLANRNYNTKHLMIYDPDPGTGGDFGEREYTDNWRKVHELAHALTYPEVNRLYGEGRRIGKLGQHRTPNEALRAVHWEHLAAHKQRELSAKLGVHISDDDFNREYNTVMHDAAHRAVTGKFTDPVKEGFQPHNGQVPLTTSLALVSGHAARMGLKPHETLKSKPVPSPVAKAEVQELDAIYTYVRGQVSMADAKNEKLYTPEEARDILLKATREKIDAFAKEIDGLRKRELAKSLIPVHAHKPASSASGGAEDVPAADMAVKAEALCKKCGKAHDLEKGCEAKDEMAKGGGPTHVCNYPACGKGIRGDKDFCSAHSGKAKPVKKDEPRESPQAQTVSDSKPEGEKSASDEHQDMLEKVTPPGVSEKTMHKLKAQYGGDKEKAYATAWKIHNKMKKALEKAEEFVDNQGHLVENGVDPDAVLPPKASGKTRSKGVPEKPVGNGQKFRDEESNGSGGAVLPGAKLKRNPGQKADDASARQFSDKGSNDPYKADSGPSDADKTYSKRGEGKDAPGPGRANGDKTYSKRGEGANDKTYAKSLADGVKKPASAETKDWMKKPAKPEASPMETSVSGVAKGMGGMPAPAMAKPPKMGAAPGTASTGMAMKGEAVEKGWKEKVAAAALAAGTAMTAGAIPAQAHHAAKRVESHIKLPGSHLRPPAGPQLPMEKGWKDKVAAGALAAGVALTAGAVKPHMDATKAKVEHRVEAGKKLAAKKSENDALMTDAPSKKDSGENSALENAAPDKVPADNKGLDAAPASKKDSGKNDALMSDAPSKKDSGKNDALASDAASKKDSGENSALEDAAPVKKAGGLDTWAGEGLPERSEEASKPKKKFTMQDLKDAKAKLVQAPKPPVAKGDLEKNWKGKVAGAMLGAGAALTGGMVKPHMDATAAKVQSQIKPPSTPMASNPLPSQRPQLSARPGPLANKPAAAPAPKKPGIFGKLQGK